MNRRGNVMIYSVMLGVVVIILALSLASVGKEFINDAMNETVGDNLGMDCGNSSISSFTKAACTITDFSLFYFFGGLIFVAGTIIVGRVVFS